MISLRSCSGAQKVKEFSCELGKTITKAFWTNDYLENDSDGKCGNQEIARREQQKDEQQKLKAENGSLVAVKQDFVKAVAIIEVENAFRVANRRVHFAVEELLEEVFFLHNIVDVFEGLRNESTSTSDERVWYFRVRFGFAYVIDESGKEAINVVIRENHFLKAVIKLHALVAERLMVVARFGFNGINELLVEESEIFGREDCVSLLIAAGQQPSMAAQILLLPLELEDHVERIDVTAPMDCERNESPRYKLKSFMQ
jgi:hypothetical protein